MIDMGMRIDPRNYAVDAELRDGGSIRIRAIGAGDQDRLHEHFRGLSPRSIYFRFMGFKLDLSAQDLKQFTELAFHDHVGLAATLTETGRARLIVLEPHLRRQGPHPTKA